jgi:hypothetical protein
LLLNVQLLLANPQCAALCCRTGERIAFSYLISNKFVGESARVVVLRDGQQQTLDIA